MNIEDAAAVDRALSERPGSLFQKSSWNRVFPNENFAGRFSLIGKDKDDEKFLLPALVGGADCSALQTQAMGIDMSVYGLTLG